MPCGSCTFCCRKEWIFLDPSAGDIAELYETEEVVHPSTQRLAKALAHKPNGDCVYLNEKGCSIHPRRPHLCRIFDCRLYYLDMQKQPRRERRSALKDQFKSRDIFEIGKALQNKHPV